MNFELLLTFFSYFWSFKEKNSIFPPLTHLVIARYSLINKNHPFGMVMDGRNYMAGNVYKYGFNGQEKENDISGVDGGYLVFEYRIQDARLGRFLSSDPLENEYPWNSPYAFAENRCIDGIDLEGKEYCPVIPKIPMEGTPMDYLSSFNNGLINLLNLVPETYNSGVYNIECLQKGIWLKTAGEEISSIGKLIKNTSVATYNYTVGTSVSEQIKDCGKILVDPKSIETATTLILGTKIPILKTSSTKTPIKANVSKSTPKSYGIVQSRINVAKGQTRFTPLRPSTGKPVSDGFNHVIEGHFYKPVTNNRSIFTVTEDNLKTILQSKQVVSSPVTAIEGGQYVRTVNVCYNIGVTTLKQGGVTTSFMQVITDKAGNLITAYPVKPR